MPDLNSRRKLIVGVTVGGSALSLLRGQLAWLNNNGWNVTLISNPDELAAKAVEREGIKFHGIPMHREISVKNDLSSLILWVKLLRFERPEAISVGTPKAGLLGTFAGWISRVPRRLYVVRGLRIEGTRLPQSLVLWVTEWLTMQLATDVFFVSESLANEAKRRRLLPLSRSWLIGQGSSNGVDSAQIEERIQHVDRASLRAELGFSEDDLVVGYLGRIHKDKGIDTLIRGLESADLNPRVKCLAIGSPENSILTNRLANHAKLLPRTMDPWKFLAAMDVLCLPTLREGFPNVVLEAAAAGVPTVTTTATGAIDSVIPGETGFLFSSGSDSELVEILNTFAKREDLAIQMGKSAQNWVRTSFLPGNIWKGLNEILLDEQEPAFARRFN